MLIFIGNQFVGDKLSTGGDIVSLEVVKRYPEPKSVLAPQIIHKSLMNAGLNGDYFSTDQSHQFRSASTILGGLDTIFRYLIRTFNTTLWLIKNYQSNQIIYLSGDFFCNTLPAFICWLLKTNCIVYSNFYHRNPKPNQRKGNLYLVSLASRSLQTFSLLLIKTMSTKIFVLSEVGKQELLNLGFNSSKLIISGAGVDPLVTQKFIKTSKIDNRLVFVGRINVTKGAFDLIPIMSLVADQYPNFELHMIGMYTDSDYLKLNNLIKKFNLTKQIKVMGFLDDIDKYKEIASAKILLLPSKEEGFGIVVTEALSLNTQVVCFDLPALQTLFSGKQGVHFALQGNNVEFSNYIIRILNSSSTPNLHTQIPTWDDVYQLQFA